MGLGRAELSFSSLIPEKIPQTQHPRIVVVGRSNVGKSSLLNAMTHPQKIFRTGKTPGLTRGVLGARVQLGTSKESIMELVDVPGTGFARNPHEREAWGEMMDVLKDKSAGKPLLFLVLIELGRRPEQEDVDLIEWLDEVPYALVFTKVDRIKPAIREESSRSWISILETAVGKPFFVSSTKNEGLNDLFKAMRSFVRNGVLEHV